MNLHDENKEVIDENHNAEESTIFTRDETGVEKSPKPNKLLLKIVAGTLSLAILITGLVVLLNLDNNGYENGPIESEHVELINVLDLDIDEIESVIIRNEHGEFTIVRDNDDDFTIEDVADYIPLDITRITRVVEHLTEVNAQRDLGTSDDVAEFGLVNPYISLYIIYSDGSETGIKIGDMNAIETGRYMMIDGVTASEPNIYLAEIMFERELIRPKYDYVQLLAVEALRETSANSRFFEEGDVAGFTSINISGAAHDEPFDLSWAADALVHYHVISPVREYASTSVIEQVLNPLNVGLFAAGAYAFSPTSEQIAEFGLNNPQSVVEYVLGDFTLTIRVGNKDDDGNYAVKINDMPVIYRMTDGAIAFALLEMEDFFMGSVIFLHIDTVSAVTFTFGGGTNRFELSHRLDDSGRNIITVTHNGVTKITQDFQELYRNILILHAISRAREPVNAEPRLTIVFESIYDYDDVTLEFFLYSARRYLVKRDGGGTAIITSEMVDTIERMVGMIIAGEPIVD